MKIIKKVVKGFFTWLKDAGVEVIAQAFTLLGLFKYNEDVRLYWFNGQTFEPNINFELIGNLMGLAIYNNTFLDLPLAHAGFKILLD